jgi:RES domain-containing protein
MPDGWRIVRMARAAAAFSGEGAAAGGGRWNTPGTPVVYLSEHKSLAALETLVHLSRRAAVRFVFFRVGLPAEVIERLPRQALSAQWTHEPPLAETQAVGDGWVRENRSAVLAVPSVIIPEEFNYLLNPAHPDFKKISIGKPQPFAFDPRLLT